MDTRKDIGQAFKERLSEFKDSPKNLVWENIETELKKDKNDSKIFPLWFNYSKIGILLLLLFFINKESLINSSDDEKQSFNKHKNDTAHKTSYCAHPCLIRTNIRQNFSLSKFFTKEKCRSITDPN
mgnify:CR=1 FL=1